MEVGEGLNRVGGVDLLYNLVWILYGWTYTGESFFFFFSGFGFGSGCSLLGCAIVSIHVPPHVGMSYCIANPIPSCRRCFLYKYSHRTIPIPILYFVLPQTPTLFISLKLAISVML